MASRTSSIADGVSTPVTGSRRVYTQSHVDYLIEAIVAVFERRDAVRGYRFTEQAAALRHFTARFAPLS